MKTQVIIIGAGPAGLFLGHILDKNGIDNIIIEAKSREYVEARVRAGVLEAGTIDTMNNLGLGERMMREGLIDNGLDMRFRGRTIHLDLPALTGRSVKIYGQQEVVKDLIAARIASGRPIIFNSEVTKIEDLQTNDPKVICSTENGEKIYVGNFIAGCDGFHGASRKYIPQNLIKNFIKSYDFSWLGILVKAPPVPDMTYTNHDRGFALCSRRSLNVSRLYLQIPNSDSLKEWSDDRIWDELHTRMFDHEKTEIQEGEIFQRDVAQLRAFVASPMQFGRMFMAGDSVHIVPPTGAKGLNMAVADARLMARGFIQYFSKSSMSELDRYTEECQLRVWKTLRFSSYLTGLLHRFSEHSDFDRELQLAELEYISKSESAQRSIAQQYVSLSDVND